MTMQPRPWLSDRAKARSDEILDSIGGLDASGLLGRLDSMVEANRTLYETTAINLNPATNVMNPRAEAMLSAGLGTRASLGHPGEKYEVGLGPIEEIEVATQALACDVFRADFAEVRISSGAMANLYVFMATASPGDAIIVPPASIGGHVTHHVAGAAGLYGLDVHEAPIDAEGHTVDVDGLAALAARVRPKLITIGTSLNLFPHPVDALRTIADEVGATLMFDAAHLSGLIAGGAWPDPLARGAHVMTMSTYKSLGGPPSGLLVTNEAELAERVDVIAYPGLTANFDVATTAALAVTLVDWQVYGAGYAQAMVDAAAELVAALDAVSIPLYRTDRGVTESHAFAIDAAEFGGGDALARRLERIGLLACAIGLPTDDSKTARGMRIGTPEVVRIGMGPAEIDEIASIMAEATKTAESTNKEDATLAARVSQLRQRFKTVRFIVG